MSALDFQAILRAERQKILNASLKTTNKNNNNNNNNNNNSHSNNSNDNDGDYNKSFKKELNEEEDRASELEKYPSFSKHLKLSSLPSHLTNLDPYILKGKVGGIRYIPNFINEEEERELVSTINQMPAKAWVQLSRRRLQTYGGTPHSDGMYQRPLPAWVLDINSRLCEIGVFGDSVAQKPNHVLLNEYCVGQGIMAHKDGPLYCPRVAILSLNGTSCLEFWKNVSEAREQRETIRTLQEGEIKKYEKTSISTVLCEKRSLLIFEGDAYLNYFHGIQDVGFDDISQIDNINLVNESYKKIDLLERKETRLSLTIRQVLKVKDLDDLLITNSSVQEEKRKERQFANSISENQ